MNAVMPAIYAAKPVLPFSLLSCKARDQSPYSCNGCSKRARCRLDKFFYISSKAHKSAACRLSGLRAVIQVTEEELAQLNHTVTRGLRRKQPLYHIIASSDLPVSQSTVYRYIDFRSIGCPEHGLTEESRLENQDRAKDSYRQDSRLPNQ